MTANPNDNKTILIVIALVLVAILGVLVFQTTQKTPEEKIADSVSEAIENVGNAVSKEHKN